MAKPVIKPFVFNDETIANTYGFFISTEGIDLTRFAKNPVMLSDHWNNNNYVLGKWTDWKKEGALLTGFPEFDKDDEDVLKVAGKVERGYINACSMGIILDKENLAYVDGKIFLSKCELAEVSIVPVPSNANAVRLYNPAGELMKEDDIKTLCLSLTDNPTQEKPTPENLNTDHNMKKIILSVAALMALGYKDQPADGIDVSDVEAKVLGLSSQVKNLTDENASLKLAAKNAKEAQEAAVKLAATQKVDLAIIQGKIPADKKEFFIQLGITSPEVLQTTLDSIPVKQNFGANVHVPGGNNAGGEVKTMDEFEKLSHTEKLSFKETNPEAYKKLFNQ